MKTKTNTDGNLTMRGKNKNIDSAINNTPVLFEKAFAIRLHRHQEIIFTAGIKPREECIRNLLRLVLESKNFQAGYYEYVHLNLLQRVINLD